jgi:hypothetical protein
MTPQDQDTSRKVPIIFTRTVAAQLARVPLEFLDRLEAEDLVQPRELAEGECGYTPEDIGRLVRIRRMHETLGTGHIFTGPNGGNGNPLLPAGAGTAAGTGGLAPSLPGYKGAGVRAVSAMRFPNNLF